MSMTSTMTLTAPFSSFCERPAVRDSPVTVGACMGLDISYYRRASLPSTDQLVALLAVDADARYEVAEELNLHHLWVNHNFPGREAGLPASTWVAAEYVDGFRAGSYGSYNRWRDHLRGLAWVSTAPGPFMELVHFADNEGVIGPIVSAKLARDFAEWQERAEKFGQALRDDNGYFARKYGDWRRAFEVAADGGFVKFH